MSAAVARGIWGRRGAVLVWLVLGCPAHGDAHPPEGTAAEPTTHAPTGEGVPEPLRCGTATTAFADPSPLPADATLIALLANDAALDDALGRLEAHVRGGTSGLTVPTAFALGQWRWEVPLVLRSLDALGIATAQLAAIRTGAGRVWAVPLGCAFEAFVDGLGPEFERTDTGGAVIATPRDRSRFAHDVIVRPDAIVLCPAGLARRVLAAWERPHPVSAGTSLRQHAFDLAAAPLRIAIRETGLLGADAGDSATASHLIRVDDGGVDATLAP